MLLKADKWKDYSCIDAGNGEKLEQWKGIVLRRPDPQAIWSVENRTSWKKADAVYHRSKTGGGSWEYRKKLPESWTVWSVDYLPGKEFLPTRLPYDMPSFRQAQQLRTSFHFHQ